MWSALNYAVTALVIVMLVPVALVQQKFWLESGVPLKGQMYSVTRFFAS